MGIQALRSSALNAHPLAAPAGSPEEQARNRLASKSFDEVANAKNFIPESKLPSALRTIVENSSDHDSQATAHRITIDGRAAFVVATNDKANKRVDVTVYDRTGMWLASGFQSGPGRYVRNLQVAPLDPLPNE